MEAWEREYGGRRQVGLTSLMAARISSGDALSRSADPAAADQAIFCTERIVSSSGITAVAYTRNK